MEVMTKTKPAVLFNFEKTGLLVSYGLENSPVCHLYCFKVLKTFFKI